MAGGSIYRAKQTAIDWIEANRERLSAFDLEIWGYAEPAWREYKSAKAYVDLLRADGWDVEVGSGGMPTAFDRTLATRFGGKAVELLLQGQYGKMVANHPPDLVPIPLGEIVGKQKLVPLNYDLLQTARAMGVSFGD